MKIFYTICFKTRNLIVSVIFLYLVLVGCSKGGDAPVPDPVPVSVPALSMLSMSQPITSGNTTMQFYVNLDKAAAKVVSFDYLLADGTAVSPKDYLSSAGTVSIPPGQLQTTIDVQIKGDPTGLRRNNIQFSVSLKNPVGCTIGTASVTGTIITEDGPNLPTDNAGYTSPQSYPGLTLVWSDEFSGTSLDLNSWNQEVGNGTGGWGNNELEYYTNSTKNTFLSNGNLIIEARKEALGGFNYSSGRMTTLGKREFKYGRIDIRAKLPVSKGLWPALWMLGSNIGSVGWPACGEMDIMELVGTYPSRVTSTMHWKSAAGNHVTNGADYNLPSGDFSQQFHVFSMVWTADKISCYMDDLPYYSIPKSSIGATNPFNAAQFFIFNVAVGGNWPGSPDATTSFPQRMFVDYVRVFQ